MATRRNEIKFMRAGLKHEDEDILARLMDEGWKPLFCVSMLSLLVFVLHRKRPAGEEPEATDE